MKVEFERCGGTHNISLTTTVDTTKLPATEAEVLKKLVSQVEPDKCCARNAECCRRDNYSYTVRVTDDGGNTRTFKFKEGGNKDLVSMLTDKAIESID